MTVYVSTFVEEGDTGAIVTSPCPLVCLYVNINTIMSGMSGNCGCSHESTESYCCHFDVSMGIGVTLESFTSLHCCFTSTVNI